MPALDPFAGAQATNNDSKRDLLDAIATSGAAGQKAYEAAQASIGANKNEALSRAQQRAQLTGQDLGGADTARVSQNADLFSNYGTAQNQANQQYLQGVGAAGTSFLDKVNAIAPFVQSQNINSAADRENQYKTAIAQAQAKAQADADKVAQQQAFELQKLGITEAGQNSRANAAASAAAQKASAAQVNGITLPQLIGAVNQQPSILKDNQNILGQAVGGEKIGAANLADRAGSLGSSLGVPTNKLAGLSEPGFLNGLAGDLTKQNAGAKPTQLPPPTAPTKDVLLTVPGVDSSVADTILKDKQFQNAVTTAQFYLTAPLKNGVISAAGADLGKTPWDAFATWLQNNLDPKKTRTLDAIVRTYKPYFDQMSAP